MPVSPHQASTIITLFLFSIVNRQSPTMNRETSFTSSMRQRERLRTEIFPTRIQQYSNKAIQCIDSHNSRADGAVASSAARMVYSSGGGEVEFVPSTLELRYAHSYVHERYHIIPFSCLRAPWFQVPASVLRQAVAVRTTAGAGCRRIITRDGTLLA